MLFNIIQYIAIEATKMYIKNELEKLYKYNKYKYNKWYFAKKLKL